MEAIVARRMGALTTRAIVVVVLSAVAVFAAVFPDEVMVTFVAAPNSTAVEQAVIGREVVVV